MAKNPTPAPVTYADAGVDIDRATRTKQRIKYLGEYLRDGLAPDIQSEDHVAG